MSKNVFEKVSVLFQSVEQAVIIANRLDKAYADGVGHPEYHIPFGIDNPQMVAMNLAGLYAADTFANVSSLLYYNEVREETYIEALEDLISGKDVAVTKTIAKNLANLSWRSGQPFRDIATKPLNRITRDINKQFNLLPEDEEDKDLVQIREGARVLLEWITKPDEAKK